MTTSPPTIYVVTSAGLFGGVRVILEHVSRLAARGHPAEVWAPAGPPRWWAGRPVSYRSWPSVPALRDALGETRGQKVATWWQTAEWVTEALQGDDRGYYLVQDDERHYAGGAEEADAIFRNYGRGLTPITSSAFVRDWLRSAVGLDPVHVGIGTDLDLFRPGPARRDPGQVLTMFHPAASPGDLKGFRTALAVAGEVQRRNPGASLVTFGPDPGPVVPPGLVHRHVIGASDVGLRDLYRGSGVFLLASRHEGFGLPALEAMSCGCPVVSTYAQGNEEFCRDGDTCLMGRSVDELAAAVLRLQRDPGLAADLARSAARTARAYAWDPVVDRLAAEFWPPGVPDEPHRAPAESPSWAGPPGDRMRA